MFDYSSHVPLTTPATCRCLYMYKCNYMWRDALTEFKSQCLMFFVVLSSFKVPEVAVFGWRVCSSAAPIGARLSLRASHVTVGSAALTTVIRGQHVYTCYISVS